MLILNLIAETSQWRSSILAVNTVTTLTVCHRIVQFIYDYTKQEVHVVWIGLRACAGSTYSWSGWRPAIL